MNRKFKFIYGLFLFIGILNLIFLTRCSSPLTVVSEEGWELKADTQKEQLTISHRELGTLMQKVKLGLREKDPTFPSSWEVRSVRKGLVITTQAPPICNLEIYSWTRKIRNNLFFLLRSP